jgi:hypothetical protein
MAGFRIEGNTSGNVAEVDTANNLKVATSLVPANMGGTRIFCENDPGKATGTPYLVSPEVDDDFRLRVSNDIVLDEEDLTYSAQNFNKHRLDLTTFTGGFTTAGFNTNSGNTFTAGSATVLRTYKTFSMEGTETLALDIEGSINYASGVAVPANQTLEFGFGLLSTTTPFDCFDGVYFRANSTGVIGVLRNNSMSDVAWSASFSDWTGTTWVPANGRKYQFIVYLMPRSVEFWVNDAVSDQIWLAAEIMTPSGYGAPIASQATNMFVRHAVSGTSTISASFTLSRYNVRRGGTNISTTLNVLNARSGESINSPGTLTTTLNQAITTTGITRPAAAVPNSSTSTLTSLGGIYVETGTLALGTDAILMSYQVPALPTTTGATYAPNRRLRIDGVSIASGVTTAFVTGGFQKHFFIAYGGTALPVISTGGSTDTVTTKAYRRIMLPIVQYYTATHAPGATNSSSMTYFALQTPIYVNPGEFVVLGTFHQGVVGTVGVITHALQFDFSWE